MAIQFFIDTFKEAANCPAIIWNGLTVDYNWLDQRIEFWQKKILSSKIAPGEVIALVGDFSPESIAILFCLIENKNIIVPLNFSSKTNFEEKLKIAQVEKIITVNEFDEVEFKDLNIKSQHEHYSNLKLNNISGLVLFTSGTSGEPKGAVHVFDKLLNKFKTTRHSFKTLNFLLFDHWGGLNTLFHILSNRGVVIATKDRSPDGICKLIQQHKIELLPASPTFLNLLILSESYKNFDLNSLKIISYGTEPMPESTLKRLKVVFPKVKLMQTYGLIELGVLRSKSKSDDSLWVKVGGEGYQTRIVENILQIKADSAMLGYLNADSPFTDDGWFVTGDEVLQDGEYIRILGRKSEIINVGGEKVYPAEVESVIQEMDNVSSVTVYREKNPIIGNIVCARVSLIAKEDEALFARRLKSYCKDKLQKFMIPIKVKVVEDQNISERMKKKRLY